MVESDSSGQSQLVKDPLADDPFFRLPADSNWNACIGKQGTEENYLDGYIEAAVELVSTVIEKKMLEKRDTVALPILYNARHAVELALKFTIERLVAAGVLSSAPPRNHDIRAHLQLLSDADLGDEELRRQVRALEPFVASLSRIDDDGQELRYHLNRDEERSLSTYSLANLEPGCPKCDALRPCCCAG
jgi:HEPN domain-containing protein